MNRSGYNRLSIYAQWNYWTRKVPPHTHTLSLSLSTHTLSRAGRGREPDQRQEDPLGPEFGYIFGVPKDKRVPDKEVKLNSLALSLALSRSLSFSLPPSLSLSVYPSILRHQPNYQVTHNHHIKNKLVGERQGRDRDGTERTRKIDDGWMEGDEIGEGIPLIKYLWHVCILVGWHF